MILKFCKICGTEFTDKTSNSCAKFCSDICYRKRPSLNNSERMKIYYKNNKKKILKKSYEYKKHKFQTDIEFRILSNLRRRLWDFLRHNKNFRTQYYLGCTSSELRRYLENDYFSRTGKMFNWDLYGLEFHIDHIIPCSRFDLTKKENQVKCFNYKNLQLLEAKKNIIKGNSLKHLSKKTKNSIINCNKS